MFSLFFFSNSFNQTRAIGCTCVMWLGETGFHERKRKQPRKSTKKVKTWWNQWARFFHGEFSPLTAVHSRCMYVGCRGDMNRSLTIFERWKGDKISCHWAITTLYIQWPKNLSFNYGFLLRPNLK